MLVAAHQPNYLPNLGFFYKAAHADRFVLISNIQFEKQEGWQQRHKIPGAAGDIWLTVPVLGSQNQLLKDVRINRDVPWQRKHKRTLAIAYRRTAHQGALERILALYDQPWERLADLNIAVITALWDIIGVKTPLVVDEEVGGARHELLINICKKHGADAYLSGRGSALYMTPEYLQELKRNKIEHRLVEQNLTAGYPYTALHYILTESPAWVRELIER